MRVLIVSVLLGLTTPLSATDHVWLIGGGPLPADSEAQIEFNVNWVTQLLRADPQRRVHLYYTDGDAPAADVKLWLPNAKSPNPYEPLRRIFGEYEAPAIEYRNHQLSGVRGSTEAAYLKNQLAEQFAQLKRGDRALIVYNGHGLRDEQDAAGNTLRLWADTRLSVRELENLLSRIEPSVPVRFVFTQCYSGGFARLIHPNAENTLSLAPHTRCGFFAESETRLAEGCSASIAVGDYRDYTTYFFAALSGRTRLGEPIKGKPDLDNDGTVTPYEAHLYVLREAHNADLPRATSEVYLERWQPWYLRWFDSGAAPDNRYAQLAREVAAQYQLPTSTAELRKMIKQQRRQARAELHRLNDEKAQLQKEIPQLQKTLRNQMTLHWPELGDLYTAKAFNVLREALPQIRTQLQNDERYLQLVIKQDRLVALGEALVEAERKVTQYEKIARLRRLARLLAQFERHASAEQRDDYARLTACEQLPL